MAKKKKEFIPTDLVEKLYGEGKTEIQVITQLRSQGFTPSQIDKALKEVPKPEAPAAPAPAPAPKEEYRGRLPKEVIRPPVKIEKPVSRPLLPAPMERTPIGRPSEKITIPEELKPMEIGAPAAKKPAPAPAARPKPRPVEEKLPAPVPVKPAPTGAVRISLEELVEQIVSEHEKRVESKFKNFTAQHEDYKKRIDKLEKTVEKLNSVLSRLEKTSAQKTSSLKESAEELTTKTEALQTAFKELSKFMKK